MVREHLPYLYGKPSQKYSNANTIAPREKSSAHSWGSHLIPFGENAKDDPNASEEEKSEALRIH